MSMDVETVNSGADEPEASSQDKAKEAQDALNKRVVKIVRKRVEACKRVRRDFIQEWSTNIDYRRGKNAATDSDNARVPSSTDWSQTKAKQAQLYSQTPQVVVGCDEGEDSPYKPAIPVFQRRLNKRIRDAKVGTAMDEMLPDLINAAGVGAVMVAFETREEMHSVPTFDETKLTMSQKIQKAFGIFENPMQQVPKITDRRFITRRISPADLIWDTTFAGSDFDDAPLTGRTGRLPWAEAQRLFKLNDDDRDKCTGDDRTDSDRLIANDGEQNRDDDSVSFDEIFLWRYKFYADEPSFKAIQHMVFVKGKSEPVINEPWKGQRFDEQSGRYLGACKMPIQFCTLTYISDEPIPPSDSAIGRTAVNELIEFRLDMKDQRKHSIPVRWFDSNRIDSEIQTLLMQGDWQGMIPINGDGARAIGEVARASYPRDNMELEVAWKNELMESWQAGPNQNGVLARSGEHSASEMNIAQGNFSTRIGYERNRVVKMFLNVADVLAGLMLLYDEFDMQHGLSEQDMQRMQGGNLQMINHETILTIRADATVLLDAEQRFDRLDRFLNKTAKSGFINPKPIIEEMASLSQLDPSVVVVAPQPKGAPPANVSYRFSGVPDLMNPISLSIIRKNQDISPEDIQQSIALLHAAGMVLPLQQNPSGVPGVAGGGGPQEPPNVPDNPHPKWNTPDTIEKREAERGKQ
jgi:hypothetical protein